MNGRRDSEAPEAPRRRIVITGAAGMLGRAVVEELATDADVVPWTRADCDLTDAPATLEKLESVAPHVVVHCAAWTDVDGCEGDPDRARRENAEATLHVAQAAKAVAASLCFISTDYVFDGLKPEPYVEDDVPSPLSVYGRTKHQGEQHVLKTLPQAWVVRTSWLFGPGGRNFVRTMAELLRTRREVQVVRDQVGSPTCTIDLARALRALLSTAPFGVFHLTNAGSCSWYELARAIEAQLKTGCRIVPCSSAAFPRPAPRPANSVLANRRAADAGLPPRRDWREALRAYIALEWNAA